MLTDDLQEQLEAVLMELRVVHPHAQIQETLDIPTGLYCDPNRLGQLLSNLVGNAVTHGAKGTPVQVRVNTAGQYLVLSVHNRGPAIPADVLPSLFQPFKRPDVGTARMG